MEPVVPPELATPADAYGIAHFWQQGDAVSHSVAFVLLAMSVLSWTQILVKLVYAAKRQRISRAVDQFWQAPTLEEAATGLQRSAPHTSFADMAQQAVTAAAHFDAANGKTIGGNGERGDFLTRALRQSITRSTARLESGLTLLASIGSIAPFIGLFGTVWGIYHALLTIAASGSASIDKVSGPVGEALIMTAAGLFVAIPAVLAYNAFTRLNRVELAELDGFAHDLHAYLNTGSRVGSRAHIRVVEKGAS